MGMAAAGGKVYLFGGLVQNGGMWNGDGGIVHRSESEMCMWGCLHVANVEQRLFETYDEGFALFSACRESIVACCCMCVAFVLCGCVCVGVGVLCILGKLTSDAFEGRDRE